MIMEEELNYVAVKFKTNSASKRENLNDMEIIYDEVKTLEEKICDTTPAIKENEKKAPLCTLLHLLAASLVIICVILVLVVIAVSIHFNTVKSEQHREYIKLTAQNLQLKTEKSDLERRTEELIRERDGLNWTVRVILEYENFPVKTYCSQKVCKPCLDDWVLFQSNCYLFTKSTLSYGWRTWQESRDECSKVKADLVVIDSQDEQEFINNHTKNYNTVRHGYWIGLSKNGSWMWVDGSNVTVMYWVTQHPGYRTACGLSLPKENPLANWQKESCSMKNRWICETKALIKSDY